MANFNRDTVLQRAPDLKLLIDSSNNIKIYFEGRIIQCGHHGLSLLDVFYQPTSLNDALSKLQARIKGAQDWMDLMTTFIHLHEAGILRDRTQYKPTFGTEILGFDSATIHIAMLNDKIRTLHYLDGIREVVQEGDIVVDIGTGVGILAILAVRAGAQHVYAIEASGIGKSAKAIFEANGVADQVTLIEGWSTQIDLPEQADVLISEIIGHEPLGERVLEITMDASKRLLKPSALLIPHKIRILGLPVTIPQEELMKQTFTAQTLQNWQSWYGIDFSVLEETFRNTTNVFFINSFSARDWKTISEPLLLAEVDLKNLNDLIIDKTILFTANTSGTLNGLVEYFGLELGPTARFSTYPTQVDEANHWDSPVWIFSDPFSVEPGDKFTVTYQYRKTEDRTKVSVSRL